MGRTDAQTPIFWPPDAKNWLIWKDPHAGNDWRQEEKATTEVVQQMVVGITNSMDMSLSKLQELVMEEGSLSYYCSLWGCKESDKTEWTELIKR